MTAVGVVVFTCGCRFRPGDVNGSCPRHPDARVPEHSERPEPGTGAVSWEVPEVPEVPDYQGADGIDAEHLASLDDLVSGHDADMGAGGHVSVELIDWATIHEQGDDLVDGLLLPGRWTALAAAAKAGKTTLEMFVTVEISEGREPFDGTRIDPITVLYVDGEMGRFDLEERIRDLGHDPVNLTRWHATDMPPRLDTIDGGTALSVAAKQLGAQVVVIDGVNGTVTGAEKDDTTWRAFYDFTIWPLKRSGIAVLTGDNLGKDESLGPRGSSVKVDKPDAVIKLTRTDDGVRLATTHRRTSAYPLDRTFSIDGLDGDEPISYRHTSTAWPAGTTEAVELLDRLGIPVALGRVKVRQTLTDAGHKVRTDALAGAIRYRRIHATTPTLGNTP